MLEYDKSVRLYRNDVYNIIVLEIEIIQFYIGRTKMAQKGIFEIFILMIQ